MQKAIVNVILDESGSMDIVRDDTIGGFNQYIQTLKNDAEIEYDVTLTLFNDSASVEYAKTPLADVRPLSRSVYAPQKLTALLDAVGETLTAIGEVPSDVKCVVVIITDGHENASREFTTDQIRKMISDRDKKDNWTFAYLGAVADAWGQAGALGINVANAAQFTGATTDAAFRDTAGATLCSVRSVGKMRNFYGEHKKF
ncbi:MAG: hypothetical protein WC654_03705 [Patescibacteria group bacterium]